MGGIEVTGRRGRRCWKLLDNLEVRRGYSHLKEEALDRTAGFGTIVRQSAKRTNVYTYSLHGAESFLRG